MSNRIIQINEQAKKCISSIIRDLKDPRINEGLVSVVSVNISKDLKHCKVYVSIFGDNDKTENVMQGLKSAAGFVRKEMAEKLSLRNTPEVVFHVDHSIEHGAYINKLLNEINKEG